MRLRRPGARPGANLAPEEEVGGGGRCESNAC